MKHLSTKYLFCIIAFSLCFFLSGCSKSDLASEQGTRDNTPLVRLPVSDGKITYGNQLASIDASHTEDGYVMAAYTGSASNAKLQLTGPDQVVYTYDLISGNDYDTFPFSAGDGDYILSVLEELESEQYAVAFSQIISVTLKSPYTPFLYPNQFVNYTEDTKAVSKAAHLAADARTDLEVVTAIYHFTINDIVYDDEKAATVTTGYLPDVDQTLETQKGICFDYAALMTCMLRSQRIPTKLQIGYAGDVYHAWISTYLEEIGWVDNIIQFNGKEWSMMDPTFASGAKSNPQAEEFIKEPSNYIVKYSR